MTADAELMRLELDNQIAVARSFLRPDDPELSRRYDTSVDQVAGLGIGLGGADVFGGAPQHSSASEFGTVGAGITGRKA